MPHSAFFQFLIWLILHGTCKGYLLYTHLPTILQALGEWVFLFYPKLSPVPDEQQELNEHLLKVWVLYSFHFFF